METMAPEELLLNLNRSSLYREANTVRALIANQREQPEPVPYVDWPSVEAVQGGQHVWTADYKGKRRTLFAFIVEDRVQIKTHDDFTYTRQGGSYKAPTKFLPCTVTPHPAMEPERVEPRPLMLYGQPKHPDQATWLARFGDHWRSIGCATAYRSIDIIEVDEAATDCPEAVALWRSEGGGQ